MPSSPPSDTSSAPVGDIVYVCGTCGEHLRGAGVDHSCAARIIALQNTLEAYREALEKIARMTDGMAPEVIDHANSLRWAKRYASEALRDV